MPLLTFRLEGFGVVAGKVRKLAEQSANAAGNIRAILNFIQQETALAVNMMQESAAAVDDGSIIVNEVGIVFNEILQSIVEVKAQNESVRKAIGETNNSMEVMKDSVNNIIVVSSSSAKNIESITVTTEQQNATMQELFASSQELAGMAESLKTSYSKFII